MAARTLRVVPFIDPGRAIVHIRIMETDAERVIVVPFLFPSLIEHFAAEMLTIKKSRRKRMTKGI